MFAKFRRTSSARDDLGRVIGDLRVRAEGGERSAGGPSDLVLETGTANENGARGLDMCRGGQS